MESNLFIVMGGTGDLMRRKLLPALFHVAQQGVLEKGCLILGVARASDLDDEAYRAWAREALAEAGLDSGNGPGSWCDECLFFQTIGRGRGEDYRALAERIAGLEAAMGLPGTRAFYLALPPGAFPATIEGLGAAGLNRSRGWTRLVVEKPFGRDLASARVLNGLVHRHYDESQIYRIDHYLGKETVQNLLVFRFANPVFESLWNRDRVDSVAITVAEDLGVEDRAGYYEQAGAVRDMLQNHLTQLLSLVAMEVPVAFDADAIRNEKVKVLRAIEPLAMDDVVFGRYTAGRIDGQSVPGYLEEPGVAPDSQTETLVALKLGIDNWRWQGVPFYLRTGKRMPRRLTQIAVTFKRAPVWLFAPFDACDVHRNILHLTVQPDEGFDLCFEVKAPGEPFDLRTQSLDFDYESAFGSLPDAYETLLLDVMQGDQTLFVRADEVEAAWRVYAPLLGSGHEVRVYPAGTWGPSEADALLDRQGDRWVIR